MHALRLKHLLTLLILAIAFPVLTGCGKGAYHVTGRVLTSYDVLEPGYQFYGESSVNPVEDTKLEPLERVKVRLKNPDSGRIAYDNTSINGNFDVALPFSFGSLPLNDMELLFSKPGYEPYQIVVKRSRLKELRQSAKKAGVKDQIIVWLPPSASNL